MYTRTRRTEGRCPKTGEPPVAADTTTTKAPHSGTAETTSQISAVVTIIKTLEVKTFITRRARGTKVRRVGFTGTLPSVTATGANEDSWKVWLQKLKRRRRRSTSIMSTSPDAVCLDGNVFKA